MDAIRIRGGRPLAGSVVTDGSKNAALPFLAAALLADEELIFDDVPLVADVRTMLRVLDHLGIAGCLEPVAGAGTGEGDSADGNVVAATRPVSDECCEAPYELVKTMRASAIVLGPLLARRGRARVSLPGGCAIGARPMDLHVAALTALGAEIEVDHGDLVGRVPGGRLRGCRHHFPQVTVTGTANVMMAASLAEGTTELTGCAREPEIAALADVLIAMGARIEGAGTDRIVVEGVDRLGGGRHRVPPDRIVAGTYLVAAAMAGSDVTVERCRPADLEALVGVLREVGVTIDVGDESIRVRENGRRKAVSIRTAPHPGFPTDMQAQYMALATQVEGVTTVEETIFENRFMHVAELDRLGADIKVSGRTAIVQGPTPLAGAPVMATDLRASACLVLAGLVAEGETTIRRVYHLDRGYHRIDEKLRRLGADVERIDGERA